MTLRQLFQSIFLLTSVFLLSLSPHSQWVQSMPLPGKGPPAAESSAPLNLVASLATAGVLGEDLGESAPPEAAAASDSEALPAEKEPAAAKAEKSQTGEKPSAEKVRTTPAAAPAAAENRPAATAAPPKETQPTKPPQPEALAFRWGSSHQVSFRTVLQLTNSGSERAEHVWVDLPLLENRSPYQTNASPKTNYPIDSSKGRLASFYLDSLAPGETKQLIVDYRITLRPVALTSTNGVVEKARQAYREYAGSGNCRTLANGFVKRCRELGVTARVVNGYTRPQRALLKSGPLQGCRHSWAEFYLDDLGWVPVDLTFEYFADFPYASHLVECYDDQSVRINFLGGKVEAVWDNMILP